MNKPSILKQILPEEHSLRSRGIFHAKQTWGNNLSTSTEETPDLPRALRSLNRIVDGGLCHRCGSCVGICPTKVLTRDENEYPTIANLSSCTDCDLCVKVCPGDEFNFQENHKAVFGVDGEPESTHGHFLKAFVAHATDPYIQEHSTSGGLVTAILLDLLERKEIDGAVVIVSDENVLWKGKPIIARTREELLASMKSKYAISPTNSVFTEIRELPGKYALVGLPCQIHGFVKAAALDRILKERVVLTIGLFCHAAIEHEAYSVLWDSLGEEGKKAKKFISRIGKHPGTPYTQREDGTFYPVYFGNKTKGYRPTSIEMINILYRLYTPERCLTCFDALAEFADIAVGDPWMAPPEDHVDFYKGWSFALVRQQHAVDICNDLIAREKLNVVEVTRKEALACNTLMSHEKRWRAFRVIETHRRQGKAIPEYRMPSPKHSLSHFIKTEIHMLSHIFCFLPKYRAKVLRFMLGEGGYRLLWLNQKRRAFRFWRRDTLALVKRKMFGRT